MDELMDMIVSDESPSQISDKIKDILFSKAAERVDDYKPAAANSLFGDDSEDTEEYEKTINNSNYTESTFGIMQIGGCI